MSKGLTQAPTMLHRLRPVFQRDTGILVYEMLWFKVTTAIDVSYKDMFLLLFLAEDATKLQFPTVSVNSY